MCGFPELCCGVLGVKCVSAASWWSSATDVRLILEEGVKWRKNDSVKKESFIRTSSEADVEGACESCEPFEW